jgi:hypothetical protein
MPPAERIRKEGSVHEQGPQEEPHPPLEPSESLAPDVTGKSLLELLHEPGSGLVDSVRQLLDERTWREDAVNSWSSFLR